MRKHCGNCANHREGKNQFSEECGKCVSARLENGEMTDPSHWREKPQTNADRIRAMSDEELAKFLSKPCECTVDPTTDGYRECGNNLCIRYLLEWLKQPAEVDHGQA